MTLVDMNLISITPAANSAWRKAIGDAAVSNPRALVEGWRSQGCPEEEFFLAKDGRPILCAGRLLRMELAPDQWAWSSVS